MRTMLLFSLVVACGPGFDVGDRDSGVDVPDAALDGPSTDAGTSNDAGRDDAGTDDAGTSDATTGDAGTPSSVLARVESCADIFETRGQYFDFETQIGALTFAGAAEITGGSLRFSPGDDNPIQGGSNSFFSRQDFLSLGTCMDLRSQSPETARELIFAGKAFGDGTSCLLDIPGGIFSMRNVFNSAVIAQVNVPWAGEQLELRTFTYNEGTTSICEVMRLDTREVFRLESDAGFASEGFHVEMSIYGDGEPAEVLVHEVSTGVPHDGFQQLSDG